MDQPDVSHPFANFLYAFGAARKLLERAHEHGSFIEGIVLYVSMIDGCLRLAIVMDKQLAGDPIGDIGSYIQQVPGGPMFAEKKIYAEAHSRDLIDDDLRAEIIDLYNKRNAIIHRFFLNGVTYGSLGPLLDRYEVVYRRCSDLVIALEDRQLAQGKGMTHRGSVADRQKINDLVTRKLGFEPGV